MNYQSEISKKKCELRKYTHNCNLKTAVMSSFLLFMLVHIAFGSDNFKESSLHEKVSSIYYKIRLRLVIKKKMANT